MKLKIRVKQRDFILFLCICVALFIGCAILSVNFMSLSDGGELVGINIFTHMTGKAMALTIFLFIVSLVFIFITIHKNL